MESDALPQGNCIGEAIVANGGQSCGQEGFDLRGPDFVGVETFGDVVDDI